MLKRFWVVTVTGPMILALLLSGNVEGAAAGSALVADSPIDVMVELDTPCAVKVYIQEKAAAVGGKAEKERAALDAAKAQVSRVTKAQEDLMAGVAKAGIAVQELFRIERVFSGVAVKVASADLKALAALDGVKSVRRIPHHVPTTSTSVPFIGAPEAWDASGLNLTGDGVRIGIIDSGIDYIHTDFGGSGSSGDYAANDPTVLGDVTFPTAKVVGGYDFVGDDYDSGDSAHSTPHPDPDPMDAGGHGTHVAGTAAGFGVNDDGSTYTGAYGPTTDFGALRIGPGVAPKALLYAIKVFGEEGSTAVVSQAIDWAVDPNDDGDMSDHLDVINLSLGSTFEVPDDVDAEAANNASLAGVMVVGSAGNSGDTYFILGGVGRAEHCISVANSYDDGTGSLSLLVNDPAGIAGYYDMGTAAFGPELDSTGVTGDLVCANPANACSDIVNGAELAGRIALVDRGTCDFSAKVYAAQQAGAIAVVVANNVDGPVMTMGAGANAELVIIPSVFVTKDTGDVLKAALQSSAVSVTLSSSVLVEHPEYADTLSTSSSRGPAMDGYLKPDISAPGTDIAAPKSGSGSSAVLMSGTSMAAPHVTGAMALLREAHPAWSGQELKQLVMNTASHSLYKGDNYTLPRYGVARVGAGRIDVAQAVESSILACNSEEPAWVSVTFATREVVDSATEDAVIRVVNKGAAAATLNVAVDTVTDVPGVTVALTGTASIVVSAGGTVNVPLRLTAQASEMQHTRDASEDELQSGYARQWLSEESGYVTVTDSTSGIVSRVPFYACVRPASTMAATDDRVVVPDEANTGTADITLTGTDIMTGTSFPTDIVSLVTPLELVASSAQDPEVTGFASACDLRHFGIASDYASAGSVEGATLYLGVATWGAWATPSPLSFSVLIDVGKDGADDYEVFNADQGWLTTGSSNDVLISVVRNIDTNVQVRGDFLNYFGADERDTAPFWNNVLVMPVPASALGLTSGHSSFSYSVSSYMTGVTGDWEMVDSIAGLAYDVAHPGLDFFSVAKSGVPVFEDTDGASISLTYNMTYLEANNSPGVLLLHHHNAGPNRAEVVAVIHHAQIYDVDGDGDVNAVDVQLVINGALGLTLPGGVDADVNRDGKIDAIDVQLVINAALGIV